MAGTKQGGKLAAKTNIERHGEDFYRIIGQKGGKSTPTKPRGFAAMSPEKHKALSAKGGEISRRTKQ